MTEKDRQKQTETCRNRQRQNRQTQTDEIDRDTADISRQTNKTCKSLLVSWRCNAILASINNILWNYRVYTYVTYTICTKQNLRISNIHGKGAFKYDITPFLKIYPPPHYHAFYLVMLYSDYHAFFDNFRPPPLMAWYHIWTLPKQSHFWRHVHVAMFNNIQFHFFTSRFVAINKCSLSMAIYQG